VATRQFPARMMLDSGVIIRALDYKNPSRKQDPWVRDCRAIWERALSESIVLMPPLVLLELMSGEGAPPEFPNVGAIEHVGFSYQVAEQMAKWAKPKAGKKVAKETNTTRRVVQYDMLIVGTAAFYKADMLVTLDEDVKKLAKLAKVRAEDPKVVLRGTQTELPFAG
jgi:predicted nucleic acid-binding protein